MAQKITLTSTAEKNRYSIISYYAENVSSKTASLIFNELERAFKTISLYPYSGKSINKKGHRIFILKPYGIVYKNTDDGVLILHIWDTRRNPKDNPFA